MRSEAAGPRARLCATAVAAALAAGALAGPAPASAHRPLSWSAPIPLAADVELVSAPVVADGRLLTLEVALAHRATLRSRALATGKLTTRRVALPLLAGAEAVAPYGQGSPDAPQLVVDRGGRAAVAALWCGRFVDEAGAGGDYCGEPQPFFATFSSRTGRIRRRSLPREVRTLIAGDRITEDVERRGKPAILRDLATGRTLVTLPEGASNVQGAGPFVAWDVPGPPVHAAGGTARDTITHVVRTATGRQRYAVGHSHIAAATGSRDAFVDRVTLSPTGSLDVSVSVTGRGRPVVVEPTGAVRRLAVRFGNDLDFSTQLRGDLVALQMASTCHEEGSWIVSRDGRRAFDLAAVVPGRRRDPYSAPTFLSRRTLAWNERETDGGSPGRTRVVPDVGRLPLTAGARPRCG